MHPFPFRSPHLTTTTRSSLLTLFLLLILSLTTTIPVVCGAPLKRPTTTSPVHHAVPLPIIHGHVSSLPSSPSPAVSSTLSTHDVAAMPAEIESNIDTKDDLSTAEEKKRKKEKEREKEREKEKEKDKKEKEEDKKKKLKEAKERKEQKVAYKKAAAARMKGQLERRFLQQKREETGLTEAAGTAKVEKREEEGEEGREKAVLRHMEN